jgi:hypothetical protein
VLVRSEQEFAVDHGGAGVEDAFIEGFVMGEKLELRIGGDDVDTAVAADVVDLVAGQKSRGVDPVGARLEAYFVDDFASLGIGTINDPSAGGAKVRRMISIMR